MTATTQTAPLRTLDSLRLEYKDTLALIAGIRCGRIAEPLSTLEYAENRVRTLRHALAFKLYAA